MSKYIVNPNLDGEGLHIGIVRSRFNEEIGNIQLKACLKELNYLGVDENDIVIFSVPGALELGVALLHIAESNKFDSLIALGAVIRGDTYHFDIVSNEMARSISSISLDTGIPIANGVLTVDTIKQAELRAFDKGIDCARVAVEMSNLVSILDLDKQVYENESDD